MIRSKWSRFAIAAAGLILMGSLIGVLEYRKYQETNAVKAFLTALADQDFEEVYSFLPEEQRQKYDDSEALKAAYLAHDNPIPVDWKILLVPDNNDGDFYKGTLTDSSGQLFKWHIHPKRPFLSNGPFYINRFSFELAS